MDPGFASEAIVDGLPLFASFCVGIGYPVREEYPMTVWS
jgi:hypothetical protein